MNERIKELRRQAIDFCLNKGSQGNLSEEVSAKFAELLIHDCIDAVSNHYHKVYETSAKDAIKEHFGMVEQSGWICPKCGTDRTKAVCPGGYMAAVNGDCPMYGVAQ